MENQCNKIVQSLLENKMDVNTEDKVGNLFGKGVEPPIELWIIAGIDTAPRGGKDGQFGSG